MTDEETGRRRTNLGRGLDALFGEDSGTDGAQDANASKAAEDLFKT